MRGWGDGAHKVATNDDDCGMEVPLARVILRPLLLPELVEIQVMINLFKIKDGDCHLLKNFVKVLLGLHCIKCPKFKL